MKPVKKHYRPSGIHLSRYHQGWIYAVISLSFISGLLWLLFHYFISIPGQFGETHHPLELWCLRLHGAAAMISLIVLGTLLPIHIQRSWQLQRNRYSGLGVLVIFSFLLITSYGLYYLGNDVLRNWLSILHWVIGIILFPLLAVHIILGKRKPH